MFLDLENMGKEPQFMVLLYMVLELWECTWHNNDRRTVYIYHLNGYMGVFYIYLSSIFKMNFMVLSILCFCCLGIG